MPEMIDVISSNIASVGYEEGKLFIAFKGKMVAPVIYSYEGVPEILFEELLNAPSVGRFFAENIKPEYVGKKEA